MEQQRSAEASLVPRRSPFLRFFYIRWLRRSTVALLHALLWASAFALALQLRFEVVTPELERASLKALTLVLMLRLSMFAWARLFDGLWRYTGILELERIVLATSISTLLVLIPAPLIGMPRAVLLQEWLASIAAIGGARILIRELYERHRGAKRRMPTLVIGANDTGESLIRDLHRMRGAPWEVAGFLDERPAMQGSQVHGVPVLGGTDEETLSKAIASHRVGQVIFASPVPAGEQTRQLIEACRAAGIPTKVLPSLAERIAAHGPDAVREVEIEDLLGRNPVELNVTQVAAVFQNRAVLITGAAGSIGGELARQVLRFGPRTLVLFDHNENALFLIDRELREWCTDGVLHPVLADITDERRVAWVFEHFKPDIVLHAAAHKHVCMMEANPREAARNNVLGTKLLAETADATGTGAFVLISTDKAVRPTSVMGATKRVCEMVIQHIARRSRTRFAAVRFGNVLGSNSSVVPLFQAQIASGGPVTVTHPSATRYFMTIPEASQLVLQAAALGGTGRIFLLDMGRPLKILEVARDLIVLSGLRPDVDIQIRFSGLRPGEKLNEELLLEDEAPGERPHPKIMVGSIDPPAEQHFEAGMALLARAISTGEEREVRNALSLLVPEATLEMPAGGSAPPASSASRNARTARHEKWHGSETRANRFEPPADLGDSGVPE